MNVGIVTDSTSDIDPRRAAELGIGIVPLLVVFGNRSYRDLVDLSRTEFYARLREEHELPRTSQPTAAMFEETFVDRREAAVICITISSRLSGTINAARIAAERVVSKRIEVFDSKSGAGALGMMALRAAALARAGSGVEEILKALEDERARQRVLACFPDLSHLQRTGRIGRAAAAIGTLMRVVPVLGLEDGELVVRAQVRTFARAQETMLDLALADVERPADCRFVIMHTNAPELARENAAHLRNRLRGAEPKMLEVWEAGPVIATHGGPGAVGVCIA